ncbi:MAG TPA: hypothetical protein VK983_05655, partial [Candidatus Limnocylindrales bacterium]|nr:hypothetical protein [Candidatus Limnocylindrales bacterium]
DVFEMAAAMALPATGTAFKTKYDDAGNIIGGGAGEMHDMINEIAGSDGVKAGRMLVAMRGGASQARRFDLAGGGFADQIKTLGAQKNGKLSTAAATQHIIDVSLEGQGGSYIAGARKSAVESFAPVMRQRLENTIAGMTYMVTDANGNQKPMYSQADLDRELAVIAGRYDAMASVAPENARVLADNVLSSVIVDPYNGNKATIQDLIEQRRSNSGFVEMRREYGAASRNGAYTAQQLAANQQRVTGVYGNAPPGVAPPQPPMPGA